MAKLLLTITEPAYGKQRFVTAYRFAMRARTDDHHVKIVLLEDAVSVVKEGQKVTELPGVMHEISPNCEDLVKAAVKAGIEIFACGTCLKERGLNQTEIIDGVELMNIGQFLDFVIDADKVINF
ncbi:MAG: hypothetical protein B6D58_02165 [candidate division Zixibacteria bacterium 4484_95]|nr:MAG: hypothetical protein B6D58_02165 [candidate division Zixibacteria bacterium 4484_95]